jgi:hypothetical protein
MKIKEQIPKFMNRLGKKYGFKRTNWKNKIRLQKQNEMTDFFMREIERINLELKEIKHEI